MNSPEVWECCGEMHHREELTGMLLVARDDPPEMLEPVEEALYPVALPADHRVIRIYSLQLDFGGITGSIPSLARRSRMALVS